MSRIYQKQRRLNRGAIVLVVFLTLLLGLLAPAYLPMHWHWFASYFASVNLVTWLVFIYDKRIAGKSGVVRVPEKTLFVLAVAGGLPSTLCAMQVVRHKRAKPAFKWKLFGWFVLVYAAVGMAYWLFSSQLRVPI